MIDIEIPGFAHLQLEHLVLDYNGTLARDGILLDGVKDRIEPLSRRLRVHVVTADTFGNVRAALAGLPCRITVLPAEHQDIGKLNYVERLGTHRTVCVGNGRNDRLMLRAAALGIAVIQEEGAAVEALTSAHIVLPDIHAALDLLIHPLRLVATLRA
jgi:soluble P-type ATPase